MTHRRQSRASRRWAAPAACALVALVVSQVVLAAPPSPDFTISDTTPDTGQPVTFTSTASDPDGDIVAQEWDFDYDGTFDVDATGPSATHTYTTPGSYSVALRVTDDVTGDGTADTRLRVRSVSVTTPNARPVADGITATRTPPNNGDVPYEGQAIAFHGTGHDPDGDPITYEWEFGDGGTAIGQDVTHAYAARGTYTVRLRVRDNRGGLSDPRTLQVTVNALPVARINILNAAAEPGQRHTQPLAGQPFAFTAQAVPALPGEAPAPGCPVLEGSAAAPGASDPEGGALTYDWDLDDNGTFEASGLNVASPPNGYPAGQRTVRLRVTDQHNATADATLTFRVNSAPAAGFVFEPQTPVIDQQVTFSSTAADGEDGTQLTYSWDLDDDGTFCEAGETGASVRHAFATPGTRQVRLRVTDSGGITREATRQVAVQSTLPSGSFRWSPGAPLPGQAVTFTASASSPSGKAIAAIEWDFAYERASGRFDVEATGARVSHAFPTAGAKTVALRVRESGGGTLVVHDTLTVNAPPRAGFTVSPQRPIAGDTVTLSSTSLDPDGPLVRQEWDLDGDGQVDDASAAVVFATFHEPGRYPVTLRVTDQRGATARATAEIDVRPRAVAPREAVSAVVSIRGRLVRARTRVTRLAVRAPRGARILVRCRGRGCPKRLVKRSKGRTIRFRRFERTYRPRMRVIVRVTRRGLVGRETTFVVRRGRPPLRRDLCVLPGSSKAKRCPTR